ncbi:MAG: hypothetical protein ACXAB4_00705 [Candidatus Hodarchaeales archaeon]|jgi:hypothetical protein
MNEEFGVPDLSGEQILDVESGQAMKQRATDPVILPQPYSQPDDFTAQYPQPLDPTEILAMCEEVSLWQALPEEFTALNAHTWREMSSLAFVSGTTYLFFADGECPEEYTHDGNNLTVSIKNLGAKKSLSIRDIMHSAAVSSAGWHGINRLIGGFPAGEGAPGGSDLGTFRQELLADVKEKEIRTSMTLVLNGWDRYLVRGNATTNSLEFDGIENYPTNMANCTFHTNDNASSGSFSSTNFDRFLSESCAKPTHIFGHPQAVQEMLLSYFSLGFQGSQLVNFASGDRIVPGFNFAGFVNTGVGRLAVVADSWFTRTNIGGGNFQAVLYPMRLNHNGEPLVYKLTQVPLALKDLTPGCTAISFEVWAATTLIIKGCCAQGAYTSQFTGRIVTTCTQIG